MPSVKTPLRASMIFTFYFRYKPIIIYSAIAGMIAFALMSWTNDVVFVYILQVFFGSFMASEVAYYTYIYAKVERSKYQLVTGQTRSAILSGRFIGAVLAQVCVSAHWLSYLHLTYLSFTCKFSHMTNKCEHYLIMCKFCDLS